MIEIVTNILTDVKPIFTVYQSLTVDIMITLIIVTLH